MTEVEERLSHFKTTIGLTTRLNTREKTRDFILIFQLDPTVWCPEILLLTKKETFSPSCRQLRNRQRFAGS